MTHEGCVFGDTAADVTRCLHKIYASLQRLHELQDSFRIIFVIPIDRNDAAVTLIQREGLGATKLSAELARPGFYEQPLYVLTFKEINFQ